MSLTNNDRLVIGMAQNVGSELIGPVPVEEEETAVAGEDNFKQFQDEEFKREFYSMAARLFGVGNDGGILDEIRDSQQKSLDNQQELKDEVAELKTQLRLELEKERSCREKEDTRIQGKIEKIEKDLDGVGEIARSVRDRGGRFWGKVQDAAIPILVAAVLVLLVLGVQAYLNQGRRMYNPMEAQPAVLLQPEKQVKERKA